MDIESIVEELITVVQGVTFLTGGRQLPSNLSNGVFITDNWEEVLNRAFTQIIWNSDGKPSADHSSWTWVKESEIEKVYEDFYLIEKSIRIEKESICEEKKSLLFDLLSDTIPEKMSEMKEEIWSDFCLILESKFYSDIENSIFSDLLKLYHVGFMPCGWKGQYPEGDIVVFNHY